MEFLKNHYEKIVLSVVLAGLVGAVVVLILMAVDMRGVLQADPTNVSRTVSKVTPVDSTNYLVLLSNVTNPPVVNFDAGHKIFNPDKLMEGTNGQLFTTKDVGVNKLQILKIVPLDLILFPHLRGSAERPGLYLGVKTDYEPPPYNRIMIPNSVTAGKELKFGRTVTRDKGFKIHVTDVAGDPKAPDTVRIGLEFSVAGNVLTNLSLTMSNEWRHTVEYAADLAYPPENLPYPDSRVGRQMLFAGETNTILEIRAEGITVKEESTEKRTSLLYKPAP